MNADVPDGSEPLPGETNRASDAAALSSAMPAGSVAICARCHRPLDRVGPHGECLRCLSEFAWSPGATSAEADFKRAPLAADTTRYGQFQLAVGPDGRPAELGAGAMAVTYRARDTVLHFEVALKVINRTLAEHPDARARFLREARAAARLRHPNVASVFHYGEQGSECFYAMELVEGENLEARVRREGPLPVALVLEVGVQVARALAAAEACGVIHRDLKPSNLMLTDRRAENDAGEEAPLIKVIDWGLARAVGPQTLSEANLTRGFVGTPAFASPEQFRVGDAALDSRTDIYSLGVTLWYLLCGRVPFTGRNLEEIRDRQAAGTLPLEQLAAARVPGRVVALLKSMLATDPAERPRSARELLEALRRCQGSGGRGKGLAARNGRLRWLRPAVAVIGGALAAVGGAWWWHEHAQAPIPPAERSVAVLPFENLNPEAADAFFTTGMQDRIAAELARVASLKVIGADGTRHYQPEDRDLARVGQELGVAYLLEGSVRRTDARAAVDVRLVNAKNSTRIWSRRYDRPLSELFAMQGEITLAVADRLQATVTAEESAAINDLPTSDPAAYDFYLRAREAPTLTADEAAARQDARRRIALLEKAVARDPNFFLAYCDLAEAHDTLQLRQAGASAEELSVDHHAIAEGILSTARRLRPNAGELHLAQAYHLYTLNVDRANARAEIEIALRLLPNNAEVEDLAARIAYDEGRLDEATRAMEHVVLLEPWEHGALYDLARDYLKARRYEDYDRAMAKLISLTPQQDRIKGSMPIMKTMGAYEGRGDTAPLRAALASYANIEDQPGQRRDTYGILLHLADHDADALSRLLAGSQKTQFVIGVPIPKAWFEALAARLRGNEADTRVAFTAARVEMEKSTLANPTSPRLLSLLAIIDAGLGRAEAVDEARRASSLVKSKAGAPGIGCNLAVVYAWLGQSDAAIAELEKWVNLPAGEGIPSQPTYGDFRLNPLWDPLRSDPRFEALVQRLAPKG